MQAIEGLKRGSGHDTYVCAAGYLIGEYGSQVKSATPVEQFKLLQGSFLTSAVDTKVHLCPSFRLFIAPLASAHTLKTMLLMIAGCNCMSYCSSHKALNQGYKFPNSFPLCQHIRLRYIIPSTSDNYFCMKALLLTAYMKMLVASPNQGELKELVQSAFTRYAR